MSESGEIKGDEIIGCHIFGTGRWPKHLEILTEKRETFRIPMDVLIKMIKCFSSFQWKKSIEHKYIKDFRLR